MTVRVYRSTDYGAPSLTGQVGSLISVLNACLVDGYGTNNIVSLTQAGGVATAVTAVPHQFTNGPKVLISGAGSADYNGEVTATVTGANTFTYPVSPSAPASAGGAPSVKRNGAGWTKPFADGTNVAVYKQPAGTNGFYMRVDDNSTANVARMLGYETMTDVSTGLTPFPTSVQLAGGVHVVKSDAASAAVRPWILACNGPMFYLFVDYDNNATWTYGQGTAFGDITSYKAGGGDAYGTIILGSTGPSYSLNTLYYLTSTISGLVGGSWMARSYTGSGSAITVGKTSDYSKGNNNHVGTAGAPYPSPIDGGLYVAPIWINEPSPTTAVRGELPGVWCPLHAKPLMQGDVWSPVTGALAGKTFEAINLYSSAQIFVETSDTW